MRNAATMDPAHAEAYLAFIRAQPTGAANDLVGNHCFWRSDYVIHRWPDACATLKMSSRRVIGTESMNEENLLGYYLADGALYLYRRGDEYEDIAPVWDWRKLPGVTCPQSERPPTLAPGAKLTSDRSFVGGVCDGDYRLRRHGLPARRPRRPQSLVLRAGPGCLPRGRHPVRGDLPIATTINQCLLRGPVLLKAEWQRSNRARRPAPIPSTGVEWLEHDGWRYAFPSPTYVQLRASAQTGTWSRVFRNPETPRDVVRQRRVHPLARSRDKAHGRDPTPMQSSRLDRPFNGRVLANIAETSGGGAGWPACGGRLLGAGKAGGCAGERC